MEPRIPSFFDSLRRPTFAASLKVGGGLAMAQAVGLAAMPLLTRLYDPSAFGAMGTFSAIVAILAPVAALTYPSAIVLARSSDEAATLCRLSIAIASLIALAAMVVALLPITTAFVPSEIRIEWLILLLPLALILSALQQVSDYLLLRTQEFGTMAAATVGQSLLATLFKLALGILYPAAISLVLITAATPGAKAILQWGVARRSWMVGRKSRWTLRSVARAHSQMPLYRAPQALINAFSHSLPVILLGIFFGQATVGLYALAKLISDAPANLVGKSIGDVLYARLSQTPGNPGAKSNAIARSTRQLAIAGLLPLLIIWAFGPSLFALMFGEEWRESGNLARWATVISYAFVVARPSVAAIPLYRLQRKLLLIEISSVPIRICSFMTGYALLGSATGGIAGLAFASILFYASIIFIVHNNHDYAAPG